MMDEILSLLIEVRPESDFASSNDFIADGLLDSFDMVMLIDELEEKFDVKIDGTEIIPENFVSVDAIIQLIESSR